MSYIFRFHVPTVHVAESNQFSPVRRIYCKPETKIVEANGGRDIFGHAVRFDLPSDDLQTEVCKTGCPRKLGKANHQFVTIGPICSTAPTSNIDDPGICININCKQCQDNSLSKPIYSVEKTVADLLTYAELQPGDLTYMDTPPGGGAVVIGKVITGRLEGLGKTWVQAGVSNGS